MFLFDVDTSLGHGGVVARWLDVSGVAHLDQEVRQEDGLGALGQEIKAEISRAPQFRAAEPSLSLFLGDEGPGSSS